jgi:hypothetical protein
MSKIPLFLGSLLTDGGEVVCLTRLPRFTPRTVIRYSLLLEAE